MNILPVYRHELDNNCTFFMKIFVCGSSGLVGNLCFKHNAGGMGLQRTQIEEGDILPVAWKSSWSRIKLGVETL